jgi:hypothetical protein
MITRSCSPIGKLRRRHSEASVLQDEGLDLSQKAEYGCSYPDRVGEGILQDSLASLP